MSVVYLLTEWALRSSFCLRIRTFMKTLKKEVNANNLCYGSNSHVMKEREH
jgi:hypothetical protein